MAGDSLTLMGFWGSPFVLRVKWALKLKGIECQYVQEDLSNKSAMLLQYNPVYKKCVPAVMATFAKGGEEQQNAAQEARENLKTLESGLEGKRYFGGDKIGFADIAIGWLGCWVRIVEQIVGISLIDTESMSKLNAWFDDFLELPVIKECMPPLDKMLEHNKAFREVLTSSST